ncbi:ECF-type sigma factor [Streptomyces sp. NPDC050560]|uniref:ECF-type sigma factor n=1 Tax=Streptomyces sp. NPDC050560 TaxID=3365630 RepID=UPI00378FEFFC
MHHSHCTACRPTRPYGDDRSPLRALEESFLALARTPVPLTLPADLVWAEPECATLPVDQVRARLAHPATEPALRRQTWQEVVTRAQRLREPWETVALAMTLPVLRRMLARLTRPAGLERADLEQEALTAVTAALRVVDMEVQDVGRELFAAADRAVHRAVYAAWRRAARESGPQPEDLDELALPGCKDTAKSATEDADEYSVLAGAVKVQVLSVDEARLIARTRLGGELMSALAAERGVSARQLYRHRAAAEQHLAAYLRGGARGGGAREQ